MEIFHYSSVRHIFASVKKLNGKLGIHILMAFLFVFLYARKMSIERTFSVESPCDTCIVHRERNRERNAFQRWYSLAHCGPRPTYTHLPIICAVHVNNTYREQRKARRARKRRKIHARQKGDEKHFHHSRAMKKKWPFKV